MESRLLTGRSFGHLEIHERIGHGGMGEVYRASDSRLGRQVAVKRIFPHLVANPQTRDRVLREPRLASKVVHPYVATVFEVVDSEEGPLLVMEYIEGRNLHEFLEDEPPGQDQVLGWAVELSEALAAIHSCGLVHRDLKPQNVMITKDGHVKVMDFGLARVYENEPIDTTMTGLTRPGQLMGTLTYMSPEQLRGEELDSRTDLFNLGIILYQCVSGVHPFLKGTVVETQSAILTAPPGGDRAEPQLAAAGAFGETVLKLLEKVPEERYSSAADLKEDLTKISAGKQVHRVAGRRWGIVPAALTLLAAIVLVAGFVGLDSTPDRPPSRPAVAVLPIRSAAESADTAPMVSYLLSSSLGETTALRAVSASRVEESLGGIASAASLSERLAQVSRLLEPSWIVSGGLFREADSYLLAATVHDGATLEEIGHVRVDADRIAALADEAAPRILELLDGQISRTTDVAFVHSPDVPDSVYRLFYEAQELARSEDYAAARERLERALDVEPGFARASSALAEVLFRSGYESLARERIAGTLRAERERAGFGGRREDMEIVAAHARIHGHSEQAVVAYRKLVARYPDDPEVLIGLATAHGANGQPAEEQKAIERALAIDSRDPRLHLARARVSGRLGRTDNAQQSLDEAGDAFGRLDARLGPAELARAEGDLAFWRGDLDDSADAYRLAGEAYAVAGLPVRAASAARSEGVVRLALWQLDEAARLYERAFPVFRDSGCFNRSVALLSSLGSLYLRLRDLEQAETTLLAAIEEARKLENHRWEAIALNNLSRVLSISGRHEEGARRARQAMEIAGARGERRSELFSHLALGESLWRQGKTDESLQSYAVVLATEDDRFRGLRLDARLGEINAYHADGRLNEALASAAEALRLAKLLDKRDQIGFAHARRALVLATLDRKVEARQELTTAEQLLESLLDIPVFAEAMAEARLAAKT